MEANTPMYTYNDTSDEEDSGEYFIPRQDLLDEEDNGGTVFEVKFGEDESVTVGSHWGDMEVVTERVNHTIPEVVMADAPSIGVVFPGGSNIRIERERTGEEFGFEAHVEEDFYGEEGDYPEHIVEMIEIEEQTTSSSSEYQPKIEAIMEASSMKIKLIRRQIAERAFALIEKGNDFPEPGPQTLEKMDEIIQKVLITEYLLLNKMTSLLDSRLMDLAITVNQDGEELFRTPDFIIGSRFRSANDLYIPLQVNRNKWIDNYPEGMRIEFKVHHGELFIPDERRIKREMYLYYSDYSFSVDEDTRRRQEDALVETCDKGLGQVTVIILSTDEKNGFLAQIRRQDPPLLRLVIEMLNVRDQQFVKDRKDRLYELTKADFASNKTVLREIMAPQLREANLEHDFSNENWDDQFRSKEEYVEEIALNAHRMEELLNASHLKSEDMSDFIPYHFFSKPNVFVEHGWNRSKNKAKFEKEFPLEEGSTFGHSASWLLHYPAFWNMEEVTSGESIKLLSLAETRDSKAMWKWISTISVLEDISHDERLKIKSLLMEKAFYKSQSTADSIAEWASKTGQAPTLSSVEHYLHMQVATELNKIKEKVKDKILLDEVHSLKISRHGNPLWTVGNFMMEKGHVGYKGKVSKETEKRLDKLHRDILKDAGIDTPIGDADFSVIKTEKRVELGEWFENGINKDLETIKEDPVAVPISDFTDMYPLGSWSNELSNMLVGDASKAIETVINCQGFRIMHRWQKLMSTIVASMARNETKTMALHETMKFRCPETGVYIICTPSPNERLSGAIVLYGKVSDKKWTVDCSFPWVGPMEIFRMDGNVYFYTKPFRLNWEAAQASHAHYWGFLATAVSGLLLNQTIYKDPLYWAMAWNFSRQTKWALDLTYLLEKSAYFYATFGKNDLEDKFAGMTLHSVVASTLIYRLKKNHRRFAQEAYSSSINQKERQMEGIKHPVFDVTLSGWHGMLMMGYSKQLLAKLDGADPLFLLGGFFKDNMEFERWYEQSEFHPTQYNWRKEDLSIEDFVNKLLKKGPTKWDKFAFHSGVVYRASRDIVRRAMAAEDRLKVEEFRNKWVAPSLTAGSSSKTNVPTGVKYKIRQDWNEDRKRKEAYPGLRSRHTNDAMVEQHQLHKTLLSSQKGRESYKFDIPPNFKLDRQFTLEELALFSISLHNQIVVVTFQLKDQTDYGKRAFFVQLILNRNCNILWDYAGRPLLSTSANESDIIMVSGMAKYTKMQKKVKILGGDMKNMSIASDKTKYGDTYSVESMEAQLKGWLDEGYVTQSEYSIMAYFAGMLANRILLMPHKQHEAYLKYSAKTGGLEGKKVHIRGDKYIMELTDESGIFAEMLSRLTKNSLLEGDSLLAPLQNFQGFVRHSGGTLGVFNAVWSVQSANIYHFKREVLKLVCLGDINTLVQGDTHSDDSKDHTVFPIPQEEVFQVFVMKDFINQIITVNNEGRETLGYKKYSIEGGWLNLIGADGMILKEHIYPTTYMAKFYFCLEFLIPRLFSQRSSLLKTGYGSAAEMLQMVTTSDGRIFEPSIRYTAKIAAELPGKSPTSDTMSAVGRIYPLVVNGAPATVVAANLILINAAISARFGLPPGSRDKYMCLELGGLYWATPDMILLGGFGANEARILLTAHASVERTRERILQIMFNTGAIWKQKKGASRQTGNLRDHNGFSEEYMNEITKVVSESETTEFDIHTSAPEYRRDFFIVMNRTKYSILDMDELLKISESGLRPALGPQGQGLQGEALYNEMDKLVGMNKFLRSNDYAFSLMNILSRYKSPSAQASHVRNSPDVAMIARWGFWNRQVAWPFSSNVTHFLTSIGIKETISMTINEVYSAVKVLGARNDFVIPSIQVEAYKTLRELYSPIVSVGMTSSATIVKRRRGFHFEDIQAYYTEIKVPRPIRINDVNFMLYALVVWYERLLDEELNPIQEPYEVADRKRYIFRLYPHLLVDQSFKDLLSSIKAILNRFEIQTSSALMRHTRLIVALYKPSGIFGIAKVSTEPTNTFDYAVDYIKDFYSWDHVLDFSGEYGLARLEGPSMSIATRLALDVVARPIILAGKKLEVQGLENYEPGSIEIRAGRLSVPLDLSKELRVHLTLSNNSFRADWASTALAGILWKRMTEGGRLILKRCVVYDMGETYIFSFSNWCSVAIMRPWDKFMLSKNLQVKNDELRNSWIVIIDGRPEVTEEGHRIKRIAFDQTQTPISYGLSVATMISYAVADNRVGLKGADDIGPALLKRVSLNDDYAICNIFVRQKPSRGSPGVYEFPMTPARDDPMTNKGLYIINEPIEEFLEDRGFYDESKVEYARVIGLSLILPKKYTDPKTREVQTFEYSISPWKISPISSNWTVLARDLNHEEIVVLSDREEPSGRIVPVISWWDEITTSAITAPPSTVELITRSLDPTAFVFHDSGGLERITKMREWEVFRGLNFSIIIRFLTGRGTKVQDVFLKRAVDAQTPERKMSELLRIVTLGFSAWEPKGEEANCQVLLKGILLTTVCAVSLDLYFDGREGRVGTTGAKHYLRFNCLTPSPRGTYKIAGDHQKYRVGIDCFPLEVQDEIVANSSEVQTTGPWTTIWYFDRAERERCAKLIVARWPHPYMTTDVQYAGKVLTADNQDLPELENVKGLLDHYKRRYPGITGWLGQVIEFPETYVKRLFVVKPVTERLTLQNVNYTVVEGILSTDKRTCQFVPILVRAREISSRVITSNKSAHGFYSKGYDRVILNMFAYYISQTSSWDDVREWVAKLMSQSLSMF